jgi:molybdate-binding protein/DNA-binding XRE family transcriptional regulator
MAGLRNNLKKFRLEAAFTQQALAERAGISRQAYSAVEAGDANPSTEVALRLARVLEQSVESVFFLPQELPGTVEVELVGEAGAASQQIGMPGEMPKRARVYRVGQRLFARPLTGPGNARHTLVAAEGIIVPGRTASIPGRSPGKSVAVQPFDRDDLDTSSLVMLGCDPAVGLLEPELRRRGIRLVAAEESSQEALLGLARGEAHVAGCHLFDDATGTFNRSWVRRLVPFPCTLVTFASWEQGLIIAPGNPKRIQGIESLSNPGVMIVNRQKGSGSRAFLDRALRTYDIPAANVGGYESEEWGHMAVAAKVAFEAADTGIAVKAAALAMGLDFITLTEERYDLVVPDHFLNEPSVQALLDILRQDPLRRRVESLGGYDASRMGLPAAA